MRFEISDSQSESQTLLEREFGRRTLLGRGFGRRTLLGYGRGRSKVWPVPLWEGESSGLFPYG
jgi:hypothetical protein